MVTKVEPHGMELASTQFVVCFINFPHYPHNCLASDADNFFAAHTCMYAVTGGLQGIGE